jgi:hypothetical protein
VAGVAALVLHLAFHGRNEFLFWGWADMITPFLIYVVLAPSGRRLSVDAVLAGRDERSAPGEDSRDLSVEPGEQSGHGDELRNQDDQPGDRWMVAWPVRLLQIHVSLVYVVSAWSRLDNRHWIDGSMLSRVLSDGTFSRAPVLGGAPAPALTALTYLAWALELVAPFSLWQSGTRRWVVAGLVGLHVALELTTEVGYWNIVMIAALSTFMPESWLEAFADRLTTGLRRLLALPSQLRRAATAAPLR